MDKKARGDCFDDIDLRVKLKKGPKDFCKNVAFCKIFKKNKTFSHPFFVGQHFYFQMFCDI